jgi:hypothetical protein
MDGCEHGQVRHVTDGYQKGWARMDECNKLQVDKCVEYYRGVEEK